MDCPKCLKKGKRWPMQNPIFDVTAGIRIWKCRVCGHRLEQKVEEKDEK